jgi:hypothetical protein
MSSLNVAVTRLLTSAVSLSCGGKTEVIADGGGTELEEESHPDRGRLISAVNSMDKINIHCGRPSVPEIAIATPLFMFNIISYDSKASCSAFKQKLPDIIVVCSVLFVAQSERHVATRPYRVNSVLSGTPCGITI